MLMTRPHSMCIISYKICETQFFQRKNMVSNIIKLDVKVKCVENRITQAKIAKDIGITRSYVNRVIKCRLE